MGYIKVKEDGYVIVVIGPLVMMRNMSRSYLLIVRCIKWLKYSSDLMMTNPIEMMWDMVLNTLFGILGQVKGTTDGMQSYTARFVNIKERIIQGTEKTGDVKFVVRSIDAILEVGH